MDSVTQIVLGAAMGELCMGKKIGNRAQLIGAIAGTVPDLDVIANGFLNNDIDKLLVHRSYSHALPVHVFLAIPFAWLCYKIFKQKYSFKDFYILWFLGLSTHAILDSFTTYGTQLWLPFTRHLVGLNNISVVDPIYTFIFMIPLIVCLFKRRDNPSRIKIAWFAFGISSLYMALTFVSKYVAHQKFEKALVAQQIPYSQLSTSPSILNNLLWAGIAYNDSVITVGEYSHLQQDDSIKFVSFARNTHLLDQVSDKKIVKVLRWFSQDKYFVQQQSPDTLNVFLVKWGSTDFTKTEAKQRFLFYNQVTKDANGVWTDKQVEPSDTLDMKLAFSQMMQRIVKRPN
ncbi:MAG: hypothetical protein RL660_9 [Bacteroidota bacterium]|jgi:inner membrane protein